MEAAVLEAMRRAIAGAASFGQPIFTDGAGVDELFDESRFNAERASYLVASYDEGGEPVEVLVRPRMPQTSSEIIDLITAEFQRSAPRGNTHYGVQIGDRLHYVTRDADGERLTTTVFTKVRRDPRGHYESIGETAAYPTGRYIYRILGTSDDPEGGNIGEIVELGGGRISNIVKANDPVGFSVIFSVPFDATPAEKKAGGGRGGSRGGLKGGGLMRYAGCHAPWRTDALTDPYFAGMSDEDHERLFINMCVARAMKNLDLSEEYIRNELVPRFTGPHGATNSLSPYSSHEIEHFRENLTLLRGLVITMEEVKARIDALDAELQPLIFTRHRTSRQYRAPLSFGGGYTADVFWPTYHDPAPQHVAQVERLRTALEADWERYRTVLKGIVMLVQDDPVLTQFISGLDMSSGLPARKQGTPLSSLLSDNVDLRKAQDQIIDQLDKMLASIARARQKLCRDPESVLDVPALLSQVLAIVEGVNPRFDKVARAMIQSHQEEKSWIDIGLGVIGLILFVAGLFVSLFGGPAGVAAFLTVAGLVAGGVTALRSADKAMFETIISEASVVRGGGFISLESAADARFWATIDAVFLVVEVKLSTLKAARGIALARQTESAARAAHALQSGSKVPFEELFKIAAGKPNELVLTAAEFRALTSTNWQLVGATGEAVAKRIAARTGDFVFLGTKVRANQGIDLLMVRRAQFEKVFGPLTDTSRAAEILANATDAQRRELAGLLTAAEAAEDLVTLEVKASRAGVPVEELLKAARGGVAYDQTWFRNLTVAMKGSKDATVVASGKLLEEVIGTGAQNIGRVTRVGVSISPDGMFKLTRLNDQLIAMANASVRMYRGRTFTRLTAVLMRAHRTGNSARVAGAERVLRAMNAQIDALDAAVKAIKQADTAATATRAQAALKRAADAAREAAALQELGRAPAVLDALFVANATLSLNLQVARQEMAEIDAEDARWEERVKKLAADHSRFVADIERFIDDWEREEPGVEAEIDTLAQEEHRKRVQNGETE